MQVKTLELCSPTHGSGTSRPTLIPVGLCSLGLGYVVPPLCFRPPWNLSLAKTLYTCDSHFSQQLQSARGQKEYPRALHMLAA